MCEHLMASLLCGIGRRRVSQHQELHTAALGGDLEELRRLLAEGKIEPDAKDKWGYTALIKASEKGYSECVSFLLEAGAQFDRHSKWCRYTPLILAAENGHQECVRLLLHAGSDANATDEFGNTALHKATSYNNVSCVEELLKGGADVNVKNKYDITSLHVAARNGFDQITQMLVDKKGCLIDARDVDNSTPIFHACAWGRFICVRILLENGAQWNIGGRSTDTSPFAEALSRDHFAVCALLVAMYFELKSPEMTSSDPRTELADTLTRVVEGERAEEVHGFAIHLLTRMIQTSAWPQHPQHLDSKMLPEIRFCHHLISGVDINKLVAIYGRGLLVDIAVRWNTPSILVSLHQAGHQWDEVQRAQIACAFHGSGQDLEVLEETGQPRSLSLTCRVMIRSLFGHQIIHRTRMLHLPKPLKNLIVTCS